MSMDGESRDGVPRGVTRRDFLRQGVAMGGGLMVGAPMPLVAGQGHDLVLRNALVMDGSGGPGVVADVAVDGDRIVAVGRVVGRGRQELDLTDHVLAPGFIDIHSHAELSLLINPRAESRIRQGVTLEVVGQDGSSVGPWSDGQFESTRDRYASAYDVTIDFRDPVGFLRAVDRVRPAVNVATMVGQGTVRSFVVGGADRPAGPDEVRRMRELVRQALDGGAVGLSSGLEYTPGSFAPVDELVALAGELRGRGLPFASHMRNEDDRVLAAVEETIHVGRMAGVPVIVSHLKAQGERNHWKAQVALRLIEDARAAGVDIHFDRYPYVAYATTLANLFPASARAGGTQAFLARLSDPDSSPALEAYARAKVALLGSWDSIQISSTGTERNAAARGRRLGELASELGEDPFDLTLRLLEEERGQVGMIGFGMSEENTARLLAHPLGMVCSDGGAYAPYGPLSSGSPHPRGYGTFPRFLAHYVRDRGILSLEEAVRKITRMPAERLGLLDRGLVRPGMVADLVAFDPATIEDRATFEDPHQYPEGIPVVVVGGQVTIRDGEQTGVLAGRAVRAPAVAAGS